MTDWRTTHQYWDWDYDPDTGPYQVWRILRVGRRLDGQWVVEVEGAEVVVESQVAALDLVNDLTGDYRPPPEYPVT